MIKYAFQNDIILTNALQRPISWNTQKMLTKFQSLWNACCFHHKISLREFPMGIWSGLSIANTIIICMANESQKIYFWPKRVHNYVQTMTFSLTAQRLSAMLFLATSFFDFLSGLRIFLVSRLIQTCCRFPYLNFWRIALSVPSSINSSVGLSSSAKWVPSSFEKAYCKNWINRVKYY